MYSNSEVSRPEISAFVEQAQKADKFLIGQKLLPVKSVKARAAQYPRLDLAEGKLMRKGATKRNSSGTYNETNRSHGWDNYSCEDRGLEERVDDTKAKEMGGFFSLEKLTGKLVRRMVALDFEVNAAATIMSEANFAKEDAGTAYTGANIDTADVPEDIDAALEALIARGEAANTIVLSLKLWNYIKRTKQLHAYVWGKISDSTGKKQITASIFGEAFDIENVHVAKGHADTAKTKATTSISAIWGTSHIWVGNVQGGDFDNGGVGRTLVWEADCPGGLYATETYRDAKRRSDMMRVRSNSIEKLVNKNAGQLIKTNFA
jgi:hypothetical protein